MKTISSLLNTGLTVFTIMVTVGIVLTAMSFDISVECRSIGQPRPQGLSSLPPLVVGRKTRLSSNDQGRQRRETLGTRLSIGEADIQCRFSYRPTIDRYIDQHNGSFPFDRLSTDTQ